MAELLLGIVAGIIIAVIIGVVLFIQAVWGNGPHH
jgi:hypothetical protein